MSFAPKRSLFFIIFFCACLDASLLAQSHYYYSKGSERYLSDKEIDSLTYDVAVKIFSENQTPQAALDKKYANFKQLFLALSRIEMSSSFATLEAGSNRVLNAPIGSPKFEANKKLYQETFERVLRQTFNKNQILKGFLSINTSDRITLFKSTIQVQPNGKLLVTEEISIYNGDGVLNPFAGEDGGDGNNEIKRGIVRAFPLYYVNEDHLFQNTTFNLKQVLRDGKEEDYHTEHKDNGILVYTGSKDKLLEKGFYTYTLVYETDHQLKFLKDFDELSWNVTGSSWSFRIDSAFCKIMLPAGGHSLSSRCYTGPPGSTNEDCALRYLDANSTVLFKTSKPLLPGNGFTVATSWQKGLVTEMGPLKKAWYYIWSNKAVFLLPLAALFCAIFCFIFWWRVGRDPEKGTIYPQYDPPAGFSPASLGYIYRQKYDRQLTAATIVDAAVRNKIKIDVSRGGLLIKHNIYTIQRADKPSLPSITNYNDFDNDITALIGSTIEKGKYNKDLADLNKAIKDDCVKRYKNKDGFRRGSTKGFFALNRSYTTIPVLVCIIATVWAFIGGVFRALTMSNFWQIPFFFGGMILCYLVLKVFARLLKAYSVSGRELMDKIEGFRMFLSTADVPRLDLLNPPTKTLGLYEKYLPFAIALGCDIEWGKQFEAIISTALLDGTIVAASSFSQTMSRDSSFSSSFTSSFSGAISSASTPPSSSSGGGSSFGGGSSGGGGGGGGGGGW